MSAIESEDRLRDLRRVTDAALGRLDVEDLLAELLQRVRDILDADTAAVLTLDETSRHLVARAACGLEEEVRQAVHIPVGAGFAGRIAELRRPIVLDRVDETTVANSILWQKGVRKMLGVPLMSRQRVVGVLHVGRIEDRPFTDQDAELLQVVAERVVGAVEARQAAVEHAAAGQLERSLLPTALPAYEELRFATRYITPDDRQVGGDWYDIFETPDGKLWLIVGDVAGHGLGAAVVMGRIRSALRAYSLVADSPEHALDLTARKVQHFEIDMFATVVCAVSSPPFDRFRIANAGHPPPMIAAPGETAQAVEVVIDPPLGIGGARKRGAVDVALPPGGVMVLYTDGLVERRDESLDVGFARLRGAIASGDPETVCRDVLLELVGSSSPADDIAILAVQRRP